jgi:hypothetical protein
MQSCDSSPIQRLHYVHSYLCTILYTYCDLLNPGGMISVCRYAGDTANPVCDTHYSTYEIILMASLTPIKDPSKKTALPYDNCGRRAALLSCILS